jgi:hypothetical protein
MAPLIPPSTVAARLDFRKSRLVVRSILPSVLDTLPHPAHGLQVQLLGRDDITLLRLKVTNTMRPGGVP